MKMSDEPTKACVRILTIESVVRYYFWHSLEIIIKKCINAISWAFGLINWCIARALARWFGVPILACWLYWFLNASKEAMSFEFFTINIIPMAALGCFILVAWFEVPYKERKILNSYSEYKEQNNDT